MRNMLFILVISLITSYTSNALAGDFLGERFNQPTKIVKEELKQTTSSGYEAITWVSTEMERIVFKLYEALGDIMNPILYLVTALTLIGIVVGYIVNRPPSITTIGSIFITIFLMQQLLVSPDFFAAWLYDPILNLMLDLPAFVIQAIVSDNVVIDSNNPLESAFLAMDVTIGAILNLSTRIAENTGWVSGGMIMVQSFFLMAVYFALQVTFLCMFLISIGAINILLAMLPLALPFAVHPKTRKFVFNILHHSLTFLITPTILAVIMAFTIGFLGSVTDQALDIKNSQLTAFPNDFYWQAMLYGIAALFFLIKASSFAAMIIGTPDSGFGQIFGSALALGAAGYAATKATSWDGARGIVAGAGIGGTTPNSGAGVAGQVIGKGGRILSEGAVATAKSIGGR